MLPNVLQPNATDHVPVLAAEVRECLAVHPGDTVVDATFGAGGHAALLAADLQGSGKLIAIDRDPVARTYFEALERRERVQARLLRGDFGIVLPQLAANGVQADAILLGAIVTQWLVKSAYEALATPLTYGMVAFLKNREGIDVYDRKLRLNPFAIWE